jgi:hypothetical protein
MHRPILSRRALLVATMAAGCGGNGKDADAPRRLTAWKGELRDLFDDSIHPAAVGMSMDAPPPAADPKLRMRTQAADLVAQLQVRSITSPSAGARTSYFLTLQVTHPTLMPDKLREDAVDIAIRQETTSFQPVHALGQSLRGHKFIGFMRRFRGEEGPELHWHLTADAADVVQVIREVALLEKMAAEKE